MWVPDFVQQGDDLDQIQEAYRLSSRNGHFDGWCLDCARALGRPSILVPVQASSRGLTYLHILALMIGILVLWTLWEWVAR